MPRKSNHAQRTVQQHLQTVFNQLAQTAIGGSASRIARAVAATRAPSLTWVKSQTKAPSTSAPCSSTVPMWWRVCMTRLWP